tara:strand:- start:476 stop:640 length:165 start_codon:yes stop_codon:yes gene_type:complete
MVEIKATHKNGKIVFLPKKKKCIKSNLWAKYLNEDKKKAGVNQPIKITQIPLFL